MKIRNLSCVFIFIILSGTGCYKNEPVPSADFIYAGNNQFKIPCTVIFTNQAVNSFSWEWRFGDDSTSTLKDPLHTYTKPGTYAIYFRAYTESRKEWASQLKEIVIKDTLR